MSYWFNGYLQQPRYLCNLIHLEKNDLKKLQFAHDIMQYQLELSCSLFVGSGRFAPRILQICGNSDRPTGPVNSTGNVMELRFLSDFLISDRGFLVSFSAKPCPYLFLLVPLFDMILAEVFGSITTYFLFCEQFNDNVNSLSWQAILTDLSDLTELQYSF